MQATRIKNGFKITVSQSHSVNVSPLSSPLNTSIQWLPMGYEAARNVRGRHVVAGRQVVALDGIERHDGFALGLGRVVEVHVEVWNGVHRHGFVAVLVPVEKDVFEADQRAR